MLDGFFNLTAKEFVGAGDHLVVGHDVVVKRLLDDVLGDHAANLCSLIEEGKVALIVQIEVHRVA